MENDDLTKPQAPDTEVPEQKTPDVIASGPQTIEPEKSVPEMKPSGAIVSGNSVIQMEEKKPGKGLVFGMVFAILLGLVGVAFGIYGFFFKAPDNGGSQGGDSDSGQVAEDLDDKDEPETKEETSKQSTKKEEETEIKNQYIKDDLNRKISILTGISNASKDDKKVINTAMSYNEVHNFYYNKGFQSTTEKAGAVLIGSMSLFERINGYDIKDSRNAVAEYFRSKYVDGRDYNSSNYNIEYMPYEIANKIYKSLFNETMPKEDVKTKICSQEYSYVASADAFIRDVPEGCGGSGWSGIFVRKDSYKAKGDEAYVNVKIAITELAENGWEIFSDLENGTQLNKGEADIYQGVLQNDKLDSAVLDNATSYRFVFKKNANSGTYYFYKLEKV